MNLKAFISLRFLDQDYLDYRPLWVDTVEKLCITMSRKFNRIFRLPGARVTDQLCRFEYNGDFICDLSDIAYCSYEGVVEVA